MGWLDQILCKDGSQVAIDSDLGLRREERRRLRRLREGSLQFNIDSELAHRLRGCEATGCPAVSLNPDEGAPLLLGALINCVIISFPSHPVWGSDVQEVLFDEITQDANFEPKSKVADNVSGKANAAMVVARHRERLRQATQTPDKFWKQRAVLFPNLMFGLDVKAQLSRIDHGKIPIILRKLATLNDFARDWTTTKGAAPSWGNLVRSESETVRNNPDLANQRVFTSAAGSKESYLLHTDFGKGDRIHLRIDRATYLVEIGLHRAAHAHEEVLAAEIRSNCTD